MPILDSLLPDPSVSKDRSARIFNPQNKLYPFQRKVRLSEEQRQKIENDLSLIYSDWEASTASMRSQLLRWVNNSEGISEPTDKPWPESSTIYKPITETRMNIVHSFYMSIIRPRIGRLLQCVTERPWDKEESKLAADLTAYFNNNRPFNQMYVQSTSEAFWAKLRDGTVGRSLDWRKKVEKRWEIKTYKTVLEFLDKNPTPESLGMSRDQFDRVLQKLDSGQPVTLDEDMEVPVLDMPVIDTEEIKDVLVYPPSVAKQERARLIGKRFWLRKSEILQREKEGLYDNTDKVLDANPVEDRDMVDTFQSQIEGVNEVNTKYDYRIIQGRYLYDIDDDGIEEKFLISFCVDSKTLLQFDKYPLYHGNDNIRLSPFKRRPKRIWGRGVPQMLDDINTEANIQARFRINSMAIANSPFFKADETLKTRLDPNRLENRIRPGGIWWIPVNSFKNVERMDLGVKGFTENFREEASLNQSADNLLGASELRSGRETPFDPRSPAQKTAMLLQQSSIRLDDFIFDHIMAENEVLDDCLRMYYQFGPDQLRTYVQEGDQYIEKVIEKSKINRDTLHLQLSVTSLLDNPDYLKSKWEEVYIKYGPEPMVGNIPEVRWEILNQIFQNMPEASGKKILIPLEQIIAHLRAMPPAPVPPGGGKPQATPSPGASPQGVPA